jgi:hypothetical protein
VIRALGTIANKSESVSELSELNLELKDSSLETTTGGEILFGVAHLEMKPQNDELD